MVMNAKTFVLTLTCVVLASSLAARAHMCFADLYVEQRGGVPDISESFSSDCFRTTAKGACGGLSPETPRAVSLSPDGTRGMVQIQDNVNHYNMGNPGHYELAYSTIADPQTEGDFTLLSDASRNDPQTYWMATQTNMTLQFTVPAGLRNCKHCVLRASYVSNHIDEPERFIQCSDVTTVVASSPGWMKKAVAQRMLMVHPTPTPTGPSVVGLIPGVNETTLAMADGAGNTVAMATFENMVVQGAPGGHGQWSFARDVAAGIHTPATDFLPGDLMYFTLAHDTQGNKHLYTINLEPLTGKMYPFPVAQPVQALHAVTGAGGHTELYTVGIEKVGDKRNLVVAQVVPGTSGVTATTVSTTTLVGATENMQWSDLVWSAVSTEPGKAPVLHVLVRNEYWVDRVIPDVMLVSVQLNGQGGAAATTVLAKDKFVFTMFDWFQGSLLALAQPIGMDGLWVKVTIDPSTGDVVQVGKAIYATSKRDFRGAFPHMTSSPSSEDDTLVGCLQDDWTKTVCYPAVISNLASASPVVTDGPARPTMMSTVQFRK